ncbi:hypothetical protein [Sinorhizobium fredii]|uniref:hypothetical protein n=1 Tax=Rhizobium fredii TaxID=380 RepID=UPI003516B209
MQDQNGGKSKIDRIRESAGIMTVGDDSDGAMVSMVTIDGRLFAIKEGAVYAISLADDIDPQRTREDIPNTVQKIFNVGSKSELVQRLLLTAAELFRKDRLQEHVNYEAALSVVLEIMRDVVAATEIFEEFEAALKQVRAKTLTAKQRGLSLPSVPGLPSQVKSFVQKMDHAIQSVFNLACVFYGEATLRKSGKWLDGLTNHLEAPQDAKGEFLPFSKELADLGKLIRNVRHCIEHPKPKQQLRITDFSLNVNAQLVEPTIAVIHDTTPLDTAPIQEFMRFFLEQVVVGAEMLMVFLASHHIAPVGGFPVGVGEIPLTQRRLGVRYGYLINMGGQVARLG